ncbi:hypothetical protein G6F59_013384 [Rhizopus arrhizus]|nr:hypothetical protein G6F59_013384 [Rhizopus arrhizus]
MRQVRQDFRHLRHAQAQGQGHGNAQQGAAVQVDAGQDVDAGGGHGAEHDHGGAAQDGFRHGLQHARHAREQAQQDQHAGDPDADVAAGDAGQLDHAIVLREDRAGEGVEHAGQERVRAVHQDAALDALHPQRAFDGLLGHLAGGGDVADGFQGRDQVDDQHRHEQCPREAQAEVQRHGDLEERGFGVRAKQQAYTINENLLGVTMSGGEIDRWEAPGEGARGWCSPRSEWPEQALTVTLKFVEGEAVELNGKALPGDQILAQLNKLFAPYGVGRGVYTGDTVIGLKGRIVFEAPGLVSLLAAHRALEDAVLTKQQNRFKPDVARKWVELVYEGFYHDPLKTDIEAFLKSSQAKVNGEVVLETRGGRGDAVAVKAPHLRNTKGATYAHCSA